MITNTSIVDNIKEIKDEEISHRNLHNKLRIHDKESNTIVEMSYNSFLNKYRDFLDPIVIEIPLTHKEVLRFHCNPKLLSYELYGTTEYWSGLLLLNNMTTKINFKEENFIQKWSEYNQETLCHIKVYDPHKLNDIMNEILILEEVLT